MFFLCLVFLAAAALEAASSWSYLDRLVTLDDVELGLPFLEVCIWFLGSLVGVVGGLLYVAGVRAWDSRSAYELLPRL